MYQEIEKQILFIDSDKASIKLSNDDIYIDVNSNLMICQDENEYIDVCLSEFTCSRDFYSVDDSNNNFSIYYNGTDHFYQITNGFPSVLTIDEELKQDLETEFTGETFTVQYLKYEGKIEISSTFTGAVPADLSLNFNVNNSAYKIFGFSKDIHPFNIVGQNISLKGDTLVNVGGTKKDIFIRTSLVNLNNENSLDGIIQNNILGKIPVLVAPLNTISFFDINNEIFRTKINSNTITGFNIRLTTEDVNTLIGLQSNFLMTLTFFKMRFIEDQNTRILNNLYELERMKLLRGERKVIKKNIK